jgi:hypothetical protein
MMSTLLALTLASALSAPAPPEEPIKPPEGPPPTQVIASMAGSGEVEITQPVLVPETHQEERTATVNGQAVKQTVSVLAYKTVQRTHRISAEGVKVSTAAGQEVDAKDLPDKLRKPTIVLLAADGKKVDPFYLKIVKGDTLVIVAPAPTPTPAPSK